MVDGKSWQPRTEEVGMKGFRMEKRWWVMVSQQGRGQMWWEKMSMVKEIQFIFFLEKDGEESSRGSGNEPFPEKRPKKKKCIKLTIVQLYFSFMDEMRQKLPVPDMI